MCLIRLRICKNLNMIENLLDYTLRLADTALILGHRLSEWCGHAPALEQDIALSNIALDHIGQARNYYQYAAKIQNLGKTEDDLAYFRDERAYRNVLLVELPNGDFGKTLVRQFLYDAYHVPFLSALQDSKDEQLAAIATKSLKEARYHLQWSSEWVIRLGDGTEFSHQRVQQAVNELWRFTGELTAPNATDSFLMSYEIAVDLNTIRPIWENTVSDVLKQATLSAPTQKWMQKGGKEGIHTESLGYILAEMQHLQRTHPNCTW
jgi:ring-1,2-phenylacetyl-CoA epoxidase subunit PaaC